MAIRSLELCIIILRFLVVYKIFYKVFSSKKNIVLNLNNLFNNDIKEVYCQIISIVQTPNTLQGSNR